MLIYLLAFITLGTLKGLRFLFIHIPARRCTFLPLWYVIPFPAGDYGCWSQESLTSKRLLEQELVRRLRRFFRNLFPVFSSAACPDVSKQRLHRWVCSVFTSAARVGPEYRFPMTPGSYAKSWAARLILLCTLSKMYVLFTQKRFFFLKNGLFWRIHPSERMTDILFSPAEAQGRLRTLRQTEEG